jgi:hypothetical protein
LEKPEKLLSISNINRVHKFYKRLLKDLIVQGLLRLKEPAFQLRCRKAEDGVLYPLEKKKKKTFSSCLNPPTLILHEEIDYLKFERHGAAGTSSMFSHYFDLIIKLKVSKSISSAIFNGMNITIFSAL